MPEAVGNQEREAAIDRFVELFYEDGRHTWETTKWDGVHVYKLPLDLWVMQEIVFETEPEKRPFDGLV